MLKSVLLAGMMAGLGTQGVAQDNRAALALHIQELSATSNRARIAADPERQAMGAIIVEQDMLVDLCTVTVRYTEEPPEGQTGTSIVLSFDLARTRLMEPTMRSPSWVGVGRLGTGPDAPYGAYVILRFVEPYRPVAVTRRVATTEGDELPLELFPYTMEPLEDAQRPYDLNAALWEYQARYCSQTG